MVHLIATEEFVDAVENNPVLEGWGNQIVVISNGGIKMRNKETRELDLRSILMPSTVLKQNLKGCRMHMMKW